MGTEHEHGQDGNQSGKGRWSPGTTALAMVGAIAAFYLIRGQIKLSAPPTGRLIERFTIVERIVHWTNAASFITLAITGLSRSMNTFTANSCRIRIERKS